MPDTHLGSELQYAGKTPLVAVRRTEMDQATSAEKSWRSFWIVLLALFAAALAAGALASCGSGVHAGTTSTPKDCGTVQIQVNRITDSTTAAQAENCFYQAYLDCQPATL